MAGIVEELIGGEIVVQVVGTENQAVLAQRMAVQGMHYMLPVAIVMIVGSRAVGLEIGLVVLVVGV